MKSIILMLLLFSGKLAFSDTQKCSENVFDVFVADAPELESDFTFTQESKTCLLSNETFQASMGRICTKEGQLNFEYAQYKEYALDFKEKFNELDQARKDGKPRNIIEFLADELRAVEERWVALGYRWELYPAVGDISKVLREEGCWLQ